jgi:hypothetical protein
VTKRQHQWLLIASTVAFSWLAMQIVHELGHVGAAWASGGKIAEVRLHPAAISYTLLSHNPQPLFVAWMGPLMGVAMPVLAWLIARWRSVRGWYVVQFFAGFCLVANGAYLAAGTYYRIGDANELLHFGTPPALVWLFGSLTFPTGLWLWNGLGQHFGLGPLAEQVDRKVTFVVTLLLGAIVASELAFG